MTPIAIIIVTLFFIGYLEFRKTKFKQKQTKVILKGFPLDF